MHLDNLQADLEVCPAANPAAKAKIVSVSASPASGLPGKRFSLELDFEVDNATSVSEIRIAIDGPVIPSVPTQGFIQQGFADGKFSSKAPLDTKDGDPSDPSRPV